MCLCVIVFFFFFKQKTAYEMRISDWSSDVCSSDLAMRALGRGFANAPIALAFIMIFGAALPDVVGELMVVPLRDHRKQRVEALEVGVGAIGGVAQPIVGEANHLVRRLDVASGVRILERRIVADLILLKIVKRKSVV